MSGNRELDELDRRLAAWDERSRRLADQDHLGHCVVLDDLCCGRLWGTVRQTDRHLAALVESLYGKDWWRAVPIPIRIALAVFATRNENISHVASRADELHARLAAEVDAAVMRELQARRGPQ